jgi:hypothetical protein
MITEGLDLTEKNQRRYEINMRRSTGMIAYLGVRFEIRENGAHLIVRHAGMVIDFWPGTGKFKQRKPGAPYRRGVFNLLKLIGIDPKAGKEQQPCSK